MAMGVPRNQLQRVSPGVYRNAQGGMQTPTRGIPRAQLPVKPQQPGAPVNNAAPANGGTMTPAPVDAANAATPDINALNAQRQQTLNEIHRRGGLSKTPGFAKNLNSLNEQIRGIRNKPPAGAPQTGGPLIGNDTPPTPSEPAAPGVPSSVISALYPSMNYQLPENYEGSPLYKWQIKEGSTALNRKLAQRGLLDSGAELEATNRLSQSVGAQESDRLRGDFQTEADRFERVSANEANRLRDSENTAWSRRMDVFDRLNKQSPMNEAYNGLDKYSGLDMKQGQGNASNTAGNYKRVSGGGGRSAGQFTPPPASGPDYSQIDLINAIFGNSQTKNKGNIVDSVIGSLGGFLK